MNALALSCALASSVAMPAPGMDRVKLNLNIILTPTTAAQMLNADTPMMTPRFTDSGADERGWALTSQIDRRADRVAFQRIYRVASADRPFAIRTGVGTRQPDGVYRFDETMRGQCRIVSQDQIQ